MWVVDVQRNRLKQIRHGLLLSIMTVNQVLVFPANNDLTRDGDFGTVFVTDWGFCFVFVVEYNGNGGLVDTGLTFFVYKFLQVGCADLNIIEVSICPICATEKEEKSSKTYTTQVGDTQYEANSIKNVGFTGTV